MNELLAEAIYEVIDTMVVENVHDDMKKMSLYSLVWMLEEIEDMTDVQEIAKSVREHLL